MPTKYPEIFAALAAPFTGPNEVKARAAQGGRKLQYITARTAMNRLDNVLGPENWWDDYIAMEHSVLCRLTVRLPDGETITKCDAGGYAGMSDQGDDDKSGYSDSFKRACARFGLGRYLYNDGVPDFAEDAAPVIAPNPNPAPQAARPPQGRASSEDLPRSGKALFAWSRDRGAALGVDLVAEINQLAAEFPQLQGRRIVDWSGDEVGQVVPRVLAKFPRILEPSSR